MNTTCKRHGPEPHPYCVDCFKLNNPPWQKETTKHPISGLDEVQYLLPIIDETPKDSKGIG
jgi:hypothetical protein